jgi:hypothetical protein
MLTNKITALSLATLLAAPLKAADRSCFPRMACCLWFLSAIGVHAKFRVVAYDQNSYTGS